jgi:hypothetical protein
MKRAKPGSVEPKRALEPVGVYDPYRPRIYGTRDERLNRRLERDYVDMSITNEAFAADKAREIAARESVEISRDAINLEASLEAERRARKHRVKHP